MENNFTPNDELIMAYVDKEMAASQKKDFELLLLTDAGLQQRLNNLLHAKEAIFQYGIKQQVASLHSTMMQELKTSSHSSKGVKKVYRIMAAAAAAIVLFVASFWYMNKPSITADGVYNAQYVAYNIPVARGSNELSTIEGAYQNKEFLKVISIAGQLEILESKGLFLAGAAAMEINHFDKAITFFNSLLQKNASNTTVDYNDDASYYLALAYLKKKDYVQSLALFSAIYKDKQHSYYTKVTEGLLIKIKKLMKN
ncbi:MAG: hypothetical protein RL115_2448 [Bacteroidota bacterium]|jgi:tetratricopeptide (TPR) repeat protein